MRWLCKKYIKRIEELEKELSSLQDKYNQLKEEYDKDSKYYIERIKTLEEVIARSIEIPDITTTVARREPINVYEDARFKKYDFVAADVAYYKIPLEQWKTLLSLIYEKFKKVHPYIPEVFDCPISSDVAWGLGLFFADGTCGLRGDGYAGAYWRIVNSNLEYLEKAKKAFEKQWPEFNFEIKEYKSYDTDASTNFGKRKKKLYCLDLKLNREHGKQGDRGRFIEKFRNTFYLLGQKKIPAAFWESNRQAKLEFLKGFYAGDGSSGRYKRFDVKGSISAVGLAKCMMDVGWNFKVYPMGNDLFHITVNRRKEHIPFIMDYIWERKVVTYEELKEKFVGHTISYAIDFLEKEGYVKRRLIQNISRDDKGRFSSVNKHCEIIALKPYPEGCDDFALFYAGILAYAAKLAGLDMQLAFAIAWSSSHAFNLFVALDGKIWIYEPQNNSIVGQIDEVSEPYIVKMIWFMG